MNTISTLMHWNSETLSVGLHSMDETHKEFIELINQLDQADDSDFPAKFDELMKHTRDHFQRENVLMEESGFPPIHIHQGEHARVLNELEQLAAQVKQHNYDGAREYIREYIPQWFSKHAATMDSALAWHLKSRGMGD